MALIDILQFYKRTPLSVDPSQYTTLAPREKPEEPKPQPAPVISPEAASADISGSQFSSTAYAHVPEEYQAYEPVFQALNEASVTNPQARAAVISQFGLERGWDANPQDYNYGNITKGSSWTGPTNTRGDHDAQGNPITQEFRAYASAKEFVNDYLETLKRTYPESYNQITSKDFDVDKFLNGLIDGKFKYAEDPQYKNKVKTIYNQILSSFED